MTSLHGAAVLGQAERCLAVVSTPQTDDTIQSTLVNAVILDHPETGRSAGAFVTAGPVKRGSPPGPTPDQRLSPSLLK
jgi:hypothetical protein